ncbi:hypothetical protein Zmor_008720 [Zophobas morio]|uniref:Uncharacterized protein n=1 Tax=Zophobas morio TaxID=2755281 RepID=A0AA38HHJ7_9CUCU|nr:hypothetical protein Zmor_008720 [Zophobas morio]
MFSKYANANDNPAIPAWNTHNRGATNKNENNIGSVIPVKNEVAAADPMIPAVRALFSFLANIIIAMAANGYPYCINAKRPDENTVPTSIV